MCGWQVKLRDPLVTHVPYLSALETGHNRALHYIHLLFYFFLLFERLVNRIYIYITSTSQEVELGDKRRYIARNGALFPVRKERR